MDDQTIGLYTIGRVVIGKSVDDSISKYGHIVGFALNLYDELILRVQWAAPIGKESVVSDIHPSNVHLK